MIDPLTIGVTTSDSVNAIETGEYTAFTVKLSEEMQTLVIQFLLR